MTSARAKTQKKCNENLPFAFDDFSVFGCWGATFLTSSPKFILGDSKAMLGFCAKPSNFDCALALTSQQNKSDAHRKRERLPIVASSARTADLMICFWCDLHLKCQISNDAEHSGNGVIYLFDGKSYLHHDTHLLLLLGKVNRLARAERVMLILC